jgi:hypothetical protein
VLRVVGLSVFLRAAPQGLSIGTALFLLLLPGCDRQEASTSLPSDRSETAPTISVLALEPVLVATSTAENEFVNIVSIDVDSKGNIYVGDWADPAISVLSPEGRRVARIGRRGEGPGEFQHVESVQILQGDSLFVFDRGLSRVTTFAPHSSVVARTVPLAGLGLTFPLHVVRAYHHPIMLAAYAAAYTATESRDQARRIQVVKALRIDGTLIKDSVLTFPDYSQLYFRSLSGFGVVGNPFGRHGIITVSADDELYFAWTDTARVMVYSAIGEHRRSTMFPATQARVTGSDIATAATTLAARFHSILQDSAPPTWPTLREMVVDDSGRTWLGLVGGHGHTDEWVVLGKSGDVLGSLGFPSRFRLFQVRGPLAYGVLRDSADVPSVAVYRLDDRATHQGLP